MSEKLRRNNLPRDPLTSLRNCLPKGLWILVFYYHVVWPRRRGDQITETDFLLDNLLVQVCFITEMIKRTGLAPREFEFPRRDHSWRLSSVRGVTRKSEKQFIKGVIFSVSGNRGAGEFGSNKSKALKRPRNPGGSSNDGGTNNYTEMCSGSEAGSYLRRIDFVYHSTLGVRVIKKKKKKNAGATRV